MIPMDGVRCTEYTDEWYIDREKDVYKLLKEWYTKKGDNMEQIITTIALLCQITGTGKYGEWYSNAKKHQNECHKKLLNCIENSKSKKFLEYKLEDCVLKGDY